MYVFEIYHFKAKHLIKVFKIIFIKDQVNEKTCNFTFKSISKNQNFLLILYHSFFFSGL